MNKIYITSDLHLGHDKNNYDGLHKDESNRSQLEGGGNKCEEY